MALAAIRWQFCCRPLTKQVQYFSMTTQRQLVEARVEENEENLKLPLKSDGFGWKSEESNGRGGEI